MLDINMEFRKGILFVRIGGILSKNTYEYLDKELTDVISRQSIKYVVFNVEDLKYIDVEGINTLLKYNTYLVENGGKSLICGIKHNLVKIRVKSSKMLKYIFETRDELGAISLINV